jgi:hypothetical protein
MTWKVLKQPLTTASGMKDNFGVRCNSMMPCQ